MHKPKVFPLIAGIAGLVGAILTLPFFLMFLASGFSGIGSGYAESGYILLGSVTFGVPAILQIVYFFRVRRAYSSDAAKAAVAIENLRSKQGLKVLGWVCAISCGCWVLLTLGGAFTGFFVGLVGLLPMAGSTYFNFHTLLVAPKQHIALSDEQAGV